MILIDPPAVPRWGRLWSHLASDTSYDELHAFAARHGVPARGWDRDHYDVPAEAYDALVAAGAVPVSSRELVSALRRSGLRRPKADRAGRTRTRPVATRVATVPEPNPQRPSVTIGRKRLRVLADAYPDGVLGASREGDVVILNAQGAALLGIDQVAAMELPLPEVLRLLNQDGHTWLEYNRPFEAISIVRGVPEQSWLNASGEEVLTTARLVRDEPLGPVVGLAVGLRSGRGRARLDRERSDLVATVAHELRSPLTGVKGFVQALLNRWDKLSDAQRRLMLETVSSDADRLARLIAELLDVARIDTGRLQLYPRPSSAAVLVSRVVSSIEAGTSREIVLDVAEDLPDVFADPDKLTQVVTNLVENAVRHGAGRVTVTVRQHSTDEGDGVRITVDDEGEGIPAELHRRVFTKFWTTGESGGSGLGMYIVGGLTRAHGGRVSIEEAPGGGARVCVDWPSEDRRPA